MIAIDLADRLLKGEKLVWSGKPAQGLWLTGSDWLLIPFSLFWGSFAFFWEFKASSANAPLFVKLWGAPFFVLGLYLIIGRFLLDAWLRQRTYYAVTNMRILISRTGAFGKFTALKLDQLPSLTLTERADGRGTIRFGEEVPRWGRRNAGSVWTPALDSTPQFIGIENARSVFDQIQHLDRQIR